MESTPLIGNLNTNAENKPTGQSEGEAKKSHLPARTAPAESTQQAGEKRINTAGNTPLDEDFRSKLRTIDPVEKTEPKHRQRRHSKGRAADWDTKVEDLKEAEAITDEWAERTPETPENDDRYVTSVDIVDGQQVERVRRMSRKRKLDGWSRTMGFLVRSWMYLAALLVVAMVAGTVIFLKNSSNKQAGTSVTQLSDISALLKNDKITINRMLTEQDVTEALEVARAFLEAPTWEKQLTWCRRQDAIKSIVAKHHEVHPFKSVVCKGFREKQGEPSVRKEFLEGSGLFIFLHLDVGEAFESKLMAVEHVPAHEGKPDSYLVDWETSVNYQPMTMKDFQVKQPQDGIDFRVYCMPTQYYNHEYASEKEWMGYDLRNAADPDFALVGYVKRDTALAKELESSFTTQSSVVLRVKYPPNATSREQVLIDKLVHNNFYLPREDAIAGLK